MVAAGALETSDTVPDSAVMESSSLRAAFWVPCKLRTCTTINVTMGE